MSTIDPEGGDKPSGIAVAFVTAILFFIGPDIASYLPRCMASTLLLHIGVDLFLDGVYDSLHKFDTLEYGLSPPLCLSLKWTPPCSLERSPQYLLYLCCADGGASSSGEGV